MSSYLHVVLISPAGVPLHALAPGKPALGPVAERHTHAEYGVPVIASGLAEFESLPGPLGVQRRLVIVGTSPSPARRSGRAI